MRSTDVPFALPVLLVLSRLRWFAVVAQALMLGLVLVIWQVELPVFWLLGILGLTVASNLLLSMRPGLTGERVAGAVLLFDVVLLTLSLGLTGGPANPFSVVYLVYVVLGAILTKPATTWLLVALSSGGFGLLFFFNQPLPSELGGHVHHGAQPWYSAHLQGMWLAYTVAATLLALFVSQLASGLRREREERARAAHLLGLATLAAGAAHEIGNPLGTIRVAASELVHDAVRLQLSAEVVSDLELISSEVERAHGVLSRMAAGAGELAGETPAPADLGVLLGDARRKLGIEGERIDIQTETLATSVRWPVQATVQVFSQLFRNALQASAPQTRVYCLARAGEGGVHIDVRDEGRGIEPQLLSRVGEPFFTTREDGMGLGVFIARSLVEHLGGRIAFDSVLGKGTTVRVWLPLGVTS
jgi:two-component system sensor histidine kinase RegB